jgi:hypothetical protein
MDRYRSLITSAPALRSDDKQCPFPAHLANPASPSRRLLSGLTAPGTLTKLLRQLERKNRAGGGFYYPTGGIAAAYLVLLRHPPTRKGLLLFFGASPADFRSDERLARVLAVAWMFYSLLKMRDAEVNERFDQFRQEKCKAQVLDELGQDFEEEAKSGCRKALMHLLAAEDCRAGTGSVRDIVRYTGYFLKWNFSLCAPRLVAELVTNIVGLRPKMTERQARHLCGW